MRGAITIGCATALTLWSISASAQQLRLRGDVFLAAKPAVGLVTLEGEDRTRPWLDLEALVWTGASELHDEGTADALVISARVRDPAGRGEARVGRFLMATGAIRPLHLDGLAVRARSPWGTEAEAFGGVPVAPRLGVDAYDWVVGARLAHRVDRVGALGLSYYHRRDAGFLADEEVGIDVAATPKKWLDIAGYAAYDTVHPGLASGRVSLAARRPKWRYEFFAEKRSPSRLLPATSLFAALGDVPSSDIGVGARWRAAPRLDLWGDAALRWIDSSVGADLSVRAVLRLDERGAGSLGLELRRRGVDAVSSFTGVRATGRIPVNDRLAASAELELAVPDDARGRGAVWPWGLVAISWHPSQCWEAAAAIEARSSPEYDFAMSGLLRVARAWGAP